MQGHRVLPHCLTHETRTQPATCAATGAWDRRATRVVVISCFLGARMTPGMRRVLSPRRIGWSSSDAELAIEGLTDEEWKAFEKALTER